MSEKPIPPELRFLVDAERARPDAPGEAKAMAQEQLAALLGRGAGLGGGEGAGVPPGASAAGSASAAIKGVSGLGAAKLVVVFALGGLVGGSVVSAVQRPVERVVYVVREAPSVPAVVPDPEVPATSEETVPLAPSAPPAQLVEQGTRPPAAPVRTRDTELSAERVVIERARSALARGDAEAALASLVQHEREFARGQLVEEREALAVQGLVMLGQAAQANERAARFRKAFPKSLLLPLVDQALR